MGNPVGQIIEPPRVGRQAVECECRGNPGSLLDALPGVLQDERPRVKVVVDSANAFLPGPEAGEGGTGRKGDEGACEADAHLTRTLLNLR